MSSRVYMQPWSRIATNSKGEYNEQFPGMLRVMKLNNYKSHFTLTQMSYYVYIHNKTQSSCALRKIFPLIIIAFFPKTIIMFFVHLVCVFYC